jgi:hypothetical protein
MKSLPLLAAAAALSLAVSAQADPRQNPTADYMADSVSKTAGQPDSISKIWYTKDKIRVDVNHQGQQMSVIMDRGEKKMTVLIPKSKMFQTEALPESEVQNPISTGTWEVTSAGEENVAGTPTTKLNVSGKGTDGRGFKGVIWTTKENIQVKMEGEADEENKKAKVVSELRNLKIGAVDAKVFDIPKDFKPVPKN